MKRVAIIFVVLVVGLSIGLFVKVRENERLRLAPSGGSGVIEGTEVDVSARIASRILEIRVKEGDAVKAGEPLVVLDCRDPKATLEAARARLQAVEKSAAAAQAQVKGALGSARAAEAGIHANDAQKDALEANRDVTNKAAQRIERLQGEGGATAMELDRASAQVKELGEQIRALAARTAAAEGQAVAAKAQAEAAKEQAEAALAQISAARADVERAQALVDECTLSSPIAGIVETRAFEPGEVVLPGAKVLVVVGLDEVETTFYLPNRELGKAAPGLPVTLVADAYEGVSFHGKILSVSPKAEFTPRNVQTREDRDRLVYAVKVSLPNADRKLRPGMPVEVRIDGTGAGGAK